MARRGLSTASVVALAIAMAQAAPASAQGGAAPRAALAAKFAPVVWLHSADRYGPMSPDRFLAASSLRWRKSFTDGRVAAEGDVAPARLGGGCLIRQPSCYRWDAYRADQLTRPFHSSAARPAKLKTKHGFYLDVADSVRAGDTTTNPRAPMFYEIRTAGAGTRIAYWFFYGFSRPYAPFVGRNIAGRFSHEGDWENVDVAIGANGKPRSVTFYAHGDPAPTPWREVCKDIAGRETCGTSAIGRPIVFSARESHASYPTPADRLTEETAVCERHLGLRVCSRDFRNRGTRWDPAGARKGLRDVRAQPWYGFGGAWGTAGLGAEMTGPLGPSSYKLR